MYIFSRFNAKKKYLSKRQVNVLCLSKLLFYILFINGINDSIDLRCHFSNSIVSQRTPIKSFGLAPASILLSMVISSARCVTHAAIRNDDIIILRTSINDNLRCPYSRLSDANNSSELFLKASNGVVDVFLFTTVENTV